VIQRAIMAVTAFVKTSRKRIGPQAHERSHFTCQTRLKEQKNTSAISRGATPTLQTMAARCPCRSEPKRDLVPLTCMFHEGFASQGKCAKAGWTIGRRAIARLLLKGNRSSCDGTFFLKVNRYKLSKCEDAKKPSYQVDSFRKYVGFATVFVKYAG